jgi:hypothetical protein
MNKEPIRLPIELEPEMLVKHTWPNRAERRKAWRSSSKKRVRKLQVKKP